MTHRLSSLGVFAGLLLSASACAAPNIALVAIDDLSARAIPPDGFADLLPDQEFRARATPNLERLASLGATFTCAQAAAPERWGSIESVLTGRVGAPAGVATFAQALRDAGYATEATGAAWRLDDDEASWETFRPYRQRAEARHRVEKQPWPIDGDRLRLRWGRMIPTRGGDDDASVAAWETLTESLDDQLAAAWAAERIASQTAGAPPRLVAVELTGARPPWETPGVFFDRFPIDKVAAPQSAGIGDLAPPAGSMGDHGVQPELLAATPDSDLAWRTAVQAYLAAVSSADYALGKVLDEVEAANSDDEPENDWALIVFSPNGFQLGEKGVWGADTVWEGAAHAHLLVFAPGVTKPEQRVVEPVSLPSVASFVAALAGASFGEDTLTPLLTPKNGRPGAVALTTLADKEGPVAYGLRSGRFRLVHYTADGSQELYDLEKDPEGLTNLLHADNAASAEQFGLSETQVEAVRQWLACRILDELEGADAEVAADRRDLVLAGAEYTPFDESLPGDFNRDGSVDAADSTLWRDQLDTEVPVGSGADGDYDGRVERDDRNVWTANYGRKAAAE